MYVLTLAVARAVPLLFGASVVLVAGRFLHDRYRGAGHWVARGLFTAVLLVGAIGAVPTSCVR